MPFLFLYGIATVGIRLKSYEAKLMYTFFADKGLTTQHFSFFGQGFLEQMCCSKKMRHLFNNS